VERLSKPDACCLFDAYLNEHGHRYAYALLDWFRFLHTARVAWFDAGRVEVRDYREVEAAGGGRL